MKFAFASVDIRARQGSTALSAWGCLRVYVGTSEFFSCSLLMEIRGYVLLARCEYIFPGHGLVGFYFFDEKLDEFRKGLHQVFHHPTVLVLENKGTRSDAQSHNCSVDRDEAFRVVIATSSLICICPKGLMFLDHDHQRTDDMFSIKNFTY